MAQVYETENVVQLIGFYTGKKFFGADILSVQEILRDPQIDFHEELPPFIAGTVNLRGLPLPVVDLRTRLDPSTAPQDGNPTWLLIATVRESLVGYLVDSVTRIMKVSPDAIMPAPELMLSGLRSQYIGGVCKTEFGLLFVALLDRLLDTQELEALGQLQLSS